MAMGTTGRVAGAFDQVRLAPPSCIRTPNRASGAVAGPASTAPLDVAKADP